MKYAIGLALIIGMGWYLFNYTKKAKAAANTTDGTNRNDQGQVVFDGPDIDPLTGNYSPPGVKQGTVGFSVQPIQ